VLVTGAFDFPTQVFTLATVKNKIAAFGLNALFVNKLTNQHVITLYANKKTIKKQPGSRQLR